MLKSNKRKTLFVDREVQGTLATRILCHWGLLCVLTAILTLLLAFVRDPFRPVNQQLAAGWQSYVPFVIATLVLIPAFVWDTIRLTNRFAGPIMRFRRTMRQIAAGQPLQPLTFRKEDFWHELADDYNAMIERFRQLEQKSARHDVEPRDLQKVDALIAK